MRFDGDADIAARVGLQADRYAEGWAHHTTTTPDESTGRPLITEPTRADVRDGRRLFREGRSGTAGQGQPVGRSRSGTACRCQCLVED
ncbi:hypothetical protein [Streptomyces sp. SH5]|uniref:hypothetical protein n=1 Tax=Streptomyces sp. SH5 TaxID=3041765 RepID=UPI002477D7A3|nr:hypothetical protein [Streptomyces sp. SH5]WGP14747.1 hypothetical protein QFA72_06575 [Streptomyces sp. SH5]